MPKGTLPRLVAPVFNPSLAISLRAAEIVSVCVVRPKKGEAEPPLPVLKDGLTGLALAGPAVISS
eukprot:COSAG02_NODE_40997_length_399_cov_0.853333_2_plen_64_part_01